MWSQKSLSNAFVQKSQYKSRTKVRTTCGFTCNVWNDDGDDVDKAGDDGDNDEDGGEDDDDRLKTFIHLLRSGGLNKVRVLLRLTWVKIAGTAIFIDHQISVLD